ncbi:hypothetical protein COV82_03230 [Candidatus Peregrinibacteria bacterium CG11_big_fil_rev_8_21_14_0_20_46_8]|nr:MAG: hypothetical protein COV82_03230 [Candidatus Peregrinibacteria bacterium CG11_big_fil_rev_8_21_14_0_20_46_8]
MKHDFLPAAHYHFLTSLYDPFVRIFFGSLYKKIAPIIKPKEGQKILDIGCGSGLVIQALKKYQPKIEITGVDIDPKILKIAARKFHKNKIDAKLIEASATDIPLREKFDIVISTLVIHHLPTDEKKQMLQEARRLLKTGGSFFLFDFAPPKNWLGHIEAKMMHHFEPIDEAIENKYREYLKEAGFKDIQSKYRTNIFQMLEAK